MRGIYLIENVKTNEKYVGSSYKIHSRWGSHLRLLLQNRHHSDVLQKSFNDSHIEDLKFSVLEVVSTDISDKELEEKETKHSLLFGQFVNRLPLYREGKVGFTHKRETVISILKTQNRYNPICVVDIDGNLLGEFELQRDIKEKFNIGTPIIRKCLKDKRYHKSGYGFIYKKDYGSHVLKEAYVGKWVKKERQLKRKRVKLKTFDIYGNFYKEFDSIHSCASHFNTAPPNIYRKINRIYHKKILIDSMSSKYIFTDITTSIESLRVYWNNIFDVIKKSKGHFKVYDCFDKYIGNSNLTTLSKLLSVKESSIYNSTERGTYIKGLKIIK